MDTKNWNDKFEDNSYCEKCTDNAVDGMDLMAMSDSVDFLIDSAINYYKVANFAIIYRDKTDEHFNLYICNHRTYNKDSNDLPQNT